MQFMETTTRLLFVEYLLSKTQIESEFLFYERIIYY